MVGSLDRPGLQGEGLQEMGPKGHPVYTPELLFFGAQLTFDIEQRVLMLHEGLVR